MKTSELTGPALDWAVAKCKSGFDLRLENTHGKRTAWMFSFRDDEDINRVDRHYLSDYEPSTDWAQGGPIIALESIYLIPNENADGWFAHKVGCNQSDYNGPTPLVAAMRAYVASVLGDEVEVPDELL